ncbi:MAG TPA: glycine zipper 2TM domain-containing protein [Noviherbaspirillum sp.]|uniref:glycine zipper 2TM domain-containing protein n=1 Tax=Noviherbaspirillum sp. TaxID=1926288 RepID=UPI002B45AA23|nr:glycine zipper 2TM domain-containing protein [Noviherbaspirillum sp.]HJV87933.1 glycine zipper 2TM domain-containing protein [Noviherbaspirillum sp.]
MESNQSPKRIHPLMAGAAASVMLVSLVGAAAITGILPASHSGNAPVQDTQAVQAAQAPSIDSKAMVAPAPVVAQPAPQAVAPAPSYQAPVRTAQHTHVVHHHTTTAAAQPVTYASQAPAPAPQPAPVAQNSPVGIGIGAVVGGLLGNQVGHGNGRALATVAGAIGGGYIGNEIAKKNQSGQSGQ